MFRARVLIARRAKLYYTASGIIAPIGTATYRCDDTRCCIIQFCPPDDEHTCSKHVEAWNKLIKKFSASSWLILTNKYIEMHGQQNIKIWFDFICCLFICALREADRSLQCSVEVKNARICVSITRFTACCLIKHRNKCIFTFNSN